MKKWWISCAAAVILVCCGIAGCSGEKDQTQQQEDVKPLVIGENGYGSLYENLPDSDVSYSDEEIDKITEGISEWAQSTLLYDSSLEKSKKELIDTGLYESIVSEEDLEKVKSDRQSFYADNAEVVIHQAETAVASATVTRYDNKDLGKVRCETRIYGTRNGETFTRSYQLSLVINYNEGITAVYEIGKIEWE